MNDNWSEIVDILSPFVDQPAIKGIPTSVVGNCLRMLGWRTSNNSMVCSYKTNSMRTVDILLQVTKPDGQKYPIVPICVDSNFDESRLANKLSSIMLELECSIGIYIGQYLSIYYCVNESPLRIAVLKFEVDNTLGARLCSALSAEQFEEKTIMGFIEELYAQYKKQNLLRNFVVSLMSDSGLLRQIVVENLEGKGYELMEIEEAIKGLNFNVTPAKESPDQNDDVLNIKVRKPEKTHTLDTTKFSFDGVNFYSKKRFVLRVIQQYVKDHPDVTYDELENQFPSHIISKNRGVVRPLSMVEKWISENPDVSNRFCLAPEDVITLKDGMKIVVHNQWGKHFPNFLKIAKTLHDVISDKPYDMQVPVIHEVSEPHAIQISGKSLENFSKNIKR